MNAKMFLEQANRQRRGKMSLLEMQAAMFAFDAHKGQVRKFSYEPYIVHPAEVASITSQVTNDPEALAAAWLHDVVEDCGIDIHTIKMLFGDNVALYVGDLTNPSQINPELKKLNRMQRKAADREHLMNSAVGSKTVKLADILSNIHSLTYNDPSFARVWVKEKEAVLPYLEGGSIELWALASAAIGSAKLFLKV
jgi:(p)ppGpp synthase/HD superfamily hydrolase